jgi:hypothetical protein
MGSGLTPPVTSPYLLSLQEPENPSLWLDYNRIGEMDIITLCKPGEEKELKTGQTALRRRIDQSQLLAV